MYKVMLVDDNEALRMSIRRFEIWNEQNEFILQQEAINGLDALEKLDEDCIDLLITDIKMPKIDGIELLQKLVEKNIETCVVFISDYSDFEYARKGLKLGAYDYLVKPIKESDLKELFSRVKKHLDRKTNLNFYLPEKGVDLIITKILKGDNSCISEVDSLIGTMCGSTGNNVQTQALVIKSLLDKIVSEVLENFPWSNQFIFLDSIDNVDFLKFEDSSELIEFTKKSVYEIVNFLNSFIFLNKNNKIIFNLCESILLEQEKNITLSILSQKLYLNSSYISSIFKTKTGIKISDYLLRVKMERAKKMLKETSSKSFEIATRLGFKDVEYFSKLFKKYTGLSPTQYKAEV